MAETLLKAFKGIYLNVAHFDNQINRHITPLSELQLRNKALPGLPTYLYLALYAES
jgi:hypothetical protein